MHCMPKAQLPKKNNQSKLALSLYFSMKNNLVHMHEPICTRSNARFSAQIEPNFQGSNAKLHPNLSIQTPIKTNSHHPMEQPTCTHTFKLSKRNRYGYVLQY